MQTNNNNQNQEVKEFYEMGGRVEVNECDHFFKRISPTRVLCSKCGLGFFDNPFDPFPVDEINKQTEKEKNRKNYLRNKYKNSVENIN